ncbi:hypothetical protein [Candidatus Igneacidithiobacillus taiwanensis]|uniref:hypothetical protein n=1 Tax=Candidatus Igneacidithiobacillus taiwanensis TaxID=1945924 RepID=UPI00289B00D5|nr:hypothetical protein [Candidatus Igneacidithiobacillus taiwanensis]
MSLREQTKALQGAVWHFVGALDAMLEEAHSLTEAGYRVPVAWIATARKVFHNLNYRPDGVSVWTYYRWAAKSVSEHMRYFEDTDLSWSSVWVAPETQEKRRILLQRADELLDWIADRPDDELSRELELDPR